MASYTTESKVKVDPGMDPQAPDFVPDAVRPESSVGGTSDRTVTQESYDRSRQTESVARVTSPHSPAPAPAAKVTFVKFTSASTTTTDTATTNMSDNSKTPRNKRLSNGPGASSADKYPEDSPTRLRHPPPRFPAAMQNQRRHRAQPQQQKELRVDDMNAWPSLGEVNTQTRNQRRRATRTARSASTSTSGSDTQELMVSQHPNAAALSPEQQDLVESQVEAYRQSLLQKHTPIRTMSVPERKLFQLRPAPYSADQQGSAQHGSSQQYTQQQPEKQVRESRSEMASVGPPFASESLAGLLAAQQQQQLTTQEQQQASPFRTFVPGQNSACNFDRLAASQQAQREATAAQLRSAFHEMQAHRAAPVSQCTTTIAQLHSTFIEPTYGQPILTGTGYQGHQSYGLQPGAYADYSSLYGHNAPTDTPAAVSRLSQPMTGSLNPSAQGFHPQPEASTSANALRGQIDPTSLPVFGTETGRSSQNDPPIAAPVPRGQTSRYYLPVLDTAARTSAHTEASAIHGRINPAYLPVFDTGVEASSTHTDAQAPATEPAWSAADYDVSPPPSLSQALPDLLNPSASGALRPDNRSLSLSQQTGARYGIEIGGLGSSLLGTSDRTNWLPSPWNQPGQQRNTRVQPLGWEWLEQRGQWTREDRK
ncbi:hypothetical protein DPSP01_006511 [Paraphaeosphaeria sporulosa]